MKISRFRSKTTKLKKGSNKIKIIVDVDCVVADLVGGILRLVGKTDRSVADRFNWWDVKYTTEEATIIREAMDYSDAFWQNLPMIPNAMIGVKWLRDQGHQIKWVTTPYEKKYGWESDRRIWLNEHLAVGLFKETIHFTTDKRDIRATAIIDDLVNNVVTWEETNRTGLGIIFGSEMNRQLGHELVNWNDIIQMEFFKYDKVT